MKTKTTKQVMTEENVTLSDEIQIPLLKFLLYQKLPWLAHCFTTKEGGVSRGIYASLNLSFSRGDDKDAVEENYRRVAQALGFSLHQVVASDQTHTTNVRHVTAQDAGKGVVRPRDYQDVDGLITDEPDLLLATFYADCVPLYFVDPVHRAIGLSHAGWRGTVSDMGRVTLEQMEKCFGTRPHEVLCAIGPSICQECYEVGEDVATEFGAHFPGYQDEILRKIGGNKYLLDLWRANAIILENAGVLPDHLAISNICTCCNSSRLFSHRATQGKRGNLGAFLGIRSQEGGKGICQLIR